MIRKATNMTNSFFIIVIIFGVISSPFEFFIRRTNFVSQIFQIFFYHGMAGFIGAILILSVIWLTLFVIIVFFGWLKAKMDSWDNH